MVSIEIDGKEIEAREGAMIIEAADEAGIYIPRFCYHKKLSIAANCRMCLIEVEKVGKPLPACATPVTDGMKVLTRSNKAIEAQKGVMEFLLINHPLDCPICDQGGECELQDIAVGYGNDASEYGEKKRVVKDKNLGPLIATDMTRCIHCTRCVRFGDEIAGLRELGATGRGEHTEIGTYVAQAVTSEISGNVIDLCPVGALTSKPFRFSARAWEMTQRDSIAPHDCLGSNIHVHVSNNKVMRVVPRENESINETWISDRDRFSYEALNSNSRLQKPLIKTKGQWQQTDWDVALNFTIEGVQRMLNGYGGENMGVLTSAVVSTEEMYLLRKLSDSLGINNLDYRIRQQDFSDQNIEPVYPWLGQNIADLENNDSILLIGSNIRKDQPLAAHRLRKAAHKGTKVMFINTVDYDFCLPVCAKLVTNPVAYTAELAAVAKAIAAKSGKSLPEEINKQLTDVEVAQAHEDIAANLVSGSNSSVILGPQTLNHPDLSGIRLMANLIAQLSDSKVGYLPDYGNSSGARLSACVPHRDLHADSQDGLDALTMFKNPRKAYLLYDVEPEVDSAEPTLAKQALSDAEFVVCFSSFDSPGMREYADVILPIAPFTETSGTYINIEGVWQSVSAVVPTLGDARPGWKVLRVLGNLFGCNGFDFMSTEEVRDELKQIVGERKPDNLMTVRGTPKIQKPNGEIKRISEWQMYVGDSLQRRATALHETMDGGPAKIFINSSLAGELGLQNGDRASATMDGREVVLPVVLTDAVADRCALIHAGCEETAVLSTGLGALTITRV
ncbi:MAG: NADH-quinone oxidoreductase subunit NuoG [Gammaproteobacteria bacterium]|nr:NADH-quinone oxidoreductase subunit NuoG [Gammaproteobacteria bacterium]MDH5800477.1 NADH-quinone oxidoreductase subunit NuoG [Gammaproteobacteria bacterium]